MRITDVEVIPFRIPLHRPVVWAAGRMDCVDWVLVTITAEDGTRGVAEAIPRPMIYGETQVSIAHAISAVLGPMLIGQDSFALAPIWRAMEGLAGNLAAKSAIDIALHDLNGKLTGLPVHRLLGGPERSHVDLVWMVGLMDEQGMVDDAVARAAEGFRAFKVKGGIDPDSDIRVARAMREALPHVQIYIDANMKYDRDTGLRVLRALSGVLDAVEEPLPAGDDMGRVDLARRVDVPLMGDESVFTPADVARQIRLGALRRVSLKMPRTGFWLSRKIVAMCETASIPMQICTQSETTLGVAACLQLAAAYGQISLPSELTFHLEVDGRITAQAFAVENGRLPVPTAPGNGADVDPDRLDRYRVTL